MVDQELLARLNAPETEERLFELKRLHERELRGEIPRPATTRDTNNHIHTIYSLSPYSPAAAVWFAYQSGLCTAGIIDHDAIAGAREFIEAGKIVGIATTIGCEVRVSFTGTPLEGKRLNNPDEVNSAYIALHGVPHNRIDELDSVLCGIRKKRNARNVRQIKRLNALLPEEMHLDFERDVAGLSMYTQGGSVTERHILSALANRLISVYGKGARIADFLENRLNIPLSGHTADILRDAGRPAYAYDVLNVLKSGLVPRFFISGGEDSLPVADMVEVAKRIGAIPTYCYLGDVGDSPTGDKKAQKFEDDILDEVFDVIEQIGFEAIAYMPSRNTPQQLERVMQKAEQKGLMQISGEDINQPSQSFVCEKLREARFAHLAENTWALVGHELAATQDAKEIIYGANAKAAYPDLHERLRAYAQKGRALSEMR